MKEKHTYGVYTTSFSKVRKKYKKLYKTYTSAIIISSLLFVAAVVLAFTYGVNAIWAAIFYIVLVIMVTIITQVGYKKNIHSITNKCEHDQDVLHAIEIFGELLQNKMRKDYNLIIDKKKKTSTKWMAVYGIQMIIRKDGS